MGALDGLKVVEAGLLVQGPQAAATLGEWGADVIKVELPGVGDQSRWLPVQRGDSRSGYFIGCNRGKRSVTVDLRTPDGREVFFRLAEWADVVITNFAPGTLEAWGLGTTSPPYATRGSSMPRVRRTERKARMPRARAPTSARRPRAGSSARPAAMGKS